VSLVAACIRHGVDLGRRKHEPWVVAVRFRIDRALKIIFNTYSGVLTDEDLYTHQREMLADPSFSADFSQLSNYLDVTQVQVSTPAIHSLAASRSFRPGVRRAIVVSSELSYGLSRMFQMLHEESGENTEVFRDLSEARRWLGLRGEVDPDGDGQPT
jgi:hypothetical protein